MMHYEYAEFLNKKYVVPPMYKMLDIKKLFPRRKLTKYQNTQIHDHARDAVIQKSMNARANVHKQPLMVNRPLIGLELSQQFYHQKMLQFAKDKEPVQMPDTLLQSIIQKTKSVGFRDAEIPESIIEEIKYNYQQSVENLKCYEIIKPIYS